jgi:hypothetical protein
MKKYIFVALLSSLISACGGDSTNSMVGTSSDASTTTKKRDLISYMYTDETSQPLKGNGIWNYSVATDYYYGTMMTDNKPSPQSPSLAVDLGKNKDANIEYVFATFISLSSGYVPDPAPAGITTPPLIRDQCSSDGVVPWITYYALSPVKSTIYPTSPNPLGECVDGMKATAYYANINKDAPLKVVPVAEYADDTFPSYIAKASSADIKNLAAKLAGEIGSDPSTYGLAIDNEKSINSYNVNTGQANEEIFFGELARLLGLKNKYLFLFDANKSAIDLYATYKNIVLLAPLYDLDNTDPTKGPAYNPDHLSSPYTNSANNMASGTLSTSIGAGQSVMFVVPASATSTIWDYEMVYNYPYFTTTPYMDPIQNALPPGISANSNGETCATLQRDELTTTVLNALVDPSRSVTQFLGSANCNYFKNTTPLNSYFSTSLQAITSARANASPKANYLGATMYAWRISGINDINGMKSYYSAYTAPSWKGLNVSYQVGPPDIQSSSWTIFNNWVTTNK